MPEGVIVVLQELRVHVHVHCFATVFTVITLVIDCCMSELHANLCPHRNVWPEIEYCCYTRTTLFTELFTCF